jgi:hypothetical protein
MPDDATSSGVVRLRPLAAATLTTLGRMRRMPRASTTTNVVTVVRGMRSMRSEILDTHDTHDPMASMSKIDAGETWRRTVNPRGRSANRRALPPAIV